MGHLVIHVRDSLDHIRRGSNVWNTFGELLVLRRDLKLGRFRVECTGTLAAEICEQVRIQNDTDSC